MPRNSHQRSAKTAPDTAKSDGAVPTPALASPLVVVPHSVFHTASLLTAVDVKPAPYDPVAAKAALDALRPQLAAVPDDKLVQLTIDVPAAALAVMGVHAFITQSKEVLSRFESLVKAGEFHGEAIDYFIRTRKPRQPGRSRPRSKCPLLS